MNRESGTASRGQGPIQNGKPESRLWNSERGHGPIQNPQSRIRNSERGQNWKLETGIRSPESATARGDKVQSRIENWKPESRTRNNERKQSSIWKRTPESGIRNLFKRGNGKRDQSGTMLGRDEQFVCVCEQESTPGKAAAKTPNAAKHAAKQADARKRTTCK